MKGMHRPHNAKVAIGNSRINTHTNKAVSDTQMKTPSVSTPILKTTNDRDLQRPLTTHLHTVQTHGRTPLFKVNATALLSLETAHPLLDNQDGTIMDTNTITLPPLTLSGRPKPRLPDPVHTQLLPTTLIRHPSLPATLRLPL
jgi:hypothetical protein